MIDVSASRERQIYFIGITQADLSLLHMHRPWFQSVVDTVVDRFYDHVGKEEKLLAIISQWSNMDKLKQTQRGYWMSFTDGVIDEAYIEHRLKIGMIHSKVGLNSDYYIGSYMVYLDIAMQVLQDSGVDNWYQVVHALAKMFNLDSQLVLEAYERNEKEQIVNLADEQKRLLAGVTQIAQDLTGMVAELRENTQTIAESAQTTAISQETTNGLIHQLGGEMKEIESMSSLIRDISDQTHLLGLNAAIEAAHVGEAGRGFNIVAQEVRKIAAHSRQAQQQIQQKLQGIASMLNSVLNEAGTTSMLARTQASSSGELAHFVKMMEKVVQELEEMQNAEHVR